MEDEEKEIRFIELFCGVGGFRLGLERADNSQGQHLPKWGGGGTNSIGQRNISRGKTSQERGHGNSPPSKFRCVWANDNDKYSCQVYRERFGDSTQSTATKPGQAKFIKEPRVRGKWTLDKRERNLLPRGVKLTSSGIWHEGSKLLEGDITKISTSNIPDHDLIIAGFPCQSFSIAGKRRGFQDITRGTLFWEICRIIRDKRPGHLLLENVKGLLSHDNGRTFAIILLSLDELGYDVEWFVANTKYYLPQNRERVFIFGTRREGG